MLAEWINRQSPLPLIVIAALLFLYPTHAPGARVFLLHSAGCVVHQHAWFSNDIMKT